MAAVRHSLRENEAKLLGSCRHRLCHGVARVNSGTRPRYLAPCKKTKLVGEPNNAAFRRSPIPSSVQSSMGLVLPFSKYGFGSLLKYAFTFLAAIFASPSPARFIKFSAFLAWVAAVAIVRCAEITGLGVAWKMLLPNIFAPCLKNASLLSLRPKTYLVPRRVRFPDAVAQLAFLPVCAARADSTSAAVIGFSSGHRAASIS